MKPDIFPPKGMWTEVYAATGITPGTKLLLINKDTATIMAWEGATPAGIGDGQHGAPIRQFAGFWVTGGQSQCWVLVPNSAPSYTGRVCVQEVTS